MNSFSILATLSAPTCHRLLVTITMEIKHLHHCREFWWTLLILAMEDGDYIETYFFKTHV